MATKTFKQEIFAPQKLTKYQQALADYHKGTPVMFLVVSPKKISKGSSTHIGQLEDFLIQVALTANADLLNIKGTKQAQWSIAGILRSGQGKASESAKGLKRTLKM